MCFKKNDSTPKNLIIVPLKNNSYEGLKDKFRKIFKIESKDLDKDSNYQYYKERLDHEIKIILEMNYAG